VPSREQINLWQPLRSVRIVRDGPPPATPAEIETRLREAYQKGIADASVHVNQQILEQRAEVNHLRGELFRSLEDSVAAAVAEVRASLPTLTMQALRRVLARVEIGRETVESIIHELLAEIGPDVGPIELRLHPADLGLVQDLEPALARLHPGLQLVADESLRRGDCQAVTRFGKVDARLQNKIEKLEASFVAPA
jgi:flagellar biosynthesis/type III secretory pathway protein FliH